MIPARKIGPTKEKRARRRAIRIVINFAKGVTKRMIENEMDRSNRDISQYKTKRDIVKTVCNNVIKIASQPLTKIVSQPLTKIVSQPLTKIVSQPLTKIASQPLTKIASQPLTKLIIKTFDKYVDKIKETKDKDEDNDHPKYTKYYLEYLIKSASQLNPDALFELGCMLYTHKLHLDCVAVLSLLANKFYKKCDSNYEKSQVMKGRVYWLLAKCYKKEKFDEKMYHRYLILSYKKGDPLGAYDIGVEFTRKYALLGKWDPEKKEIKRKAINYLTKVHKFCARSISEGLDNTEQSIGLIKRAQHMTRFIIALHKKSLVK